MIVFLLMMIPVLLAGCRKKLPDQDYMSFSQTNALKGFFALIIFLLHVRTCFELSDSFADRSFNTVCDLIGQLSVTLFFFYSGYGIIESVKNKPGYINSFFRKRLLKILVHFDITVVLFIIAGVLTGKTYEPSRYLFALMGYRAIGNSHWFVFDILCLYFFSFVAIRISGENCLKAANLTLLMTLVFFVVFYIKKQDSNSCWYDTVFCFPLGMYFSLYRDRIRLNTKTKTLSLMLLIAVFGVSFHLAETVNRGVFFNLASIAFVLIWCVITSVVTFDNAVLRFLGTHSFAIYLLQRLPMIVFTYFGLNANRYVFTVICLAATILISVGYDFCMKKLDRKLFR